MVQWRALVLLVLLALLVQGRASPLPSASAPAPAPAPAPKEGEDEEKIYRLPDDQRILPSLYEITLSPEYTTNRLNEITAFKGKVKITANVVTASENGIYLNCDEHIVIKKEDVSIKFESYPTPSPPGTDSSPPGTDSSPPGTDSSPPGTDSSPPGTDSSPPGTDSSPPGTDSSPPGTDSSPPGTDSSPPGTDSSPPGTDSSPPGTDSSPPGTDSSPPGTDSSPPGTDSSPSDPEPPSGQEDNGKVGEDVGNEGGGGDEGDEGNEGDEGDEGDDEPKYTGIERLTQDILLIELDGQIKEGAEIIIEISYSRDFKDNELNGFYRSTYLDENNDTKTVLATQFEWTYARKAFPCFDEPEFKAEFKLSIEVTDGVKAIANTQGTEEGKRIIFGVSPVMPTYLLAFVVYEEASFTTKEADDAKFRTFGRREAINDGQGELSQADGPAMIKFLEEYTEITYYGDKDNSNSMGMTKMDQVAIPDFSSGAMENWGLVTYRESALLFKKDGSEAAKKRVSQVIAHELAHQWFGNWVTTKWWNSIWLNEGFADLFEHEVMNSKYNNWKMRERMVLDEQMYAFDADSDASSPPLTLKEDQVKSPEEIGAHFGTITYSKGGSILRQIRNVLGESDFQTAVREYLANKRFQSAKPEELIEKFVDHNNDGTMIEDDELKAILEKWTTNSGYPVITVQKDGAKDIKLTQSRFLFSTDATAQDDKYDVYLTWRTDTATGNTPTQPPRPQDWLKRTDTQKVITTLDEGWSWVILNVYQGGYYRVDYSTELWEALKTALSDHNQLSKVAALDRAALINNALSLVRDVKTRNMNYKDVFHFLLFLKHDDAFEPWAALRYSLGHVVRMMGNTTVYRNFVRNVVEDTYAKLTPDNLPANNHVQITHHVNVMTVACGGNYGPCLDWAETKLKNYLEGTPPVEVNVNLESIAYCYGLKNSPSLWDALWQKYVDARKDMTRRQLIASALGCVNDAAKLRTYLDKSLGSDVPQHEKYLVFSAVYANLNGGPDAALEFLIEKGIGEVAKQYGEDRMKSLLNGLAGYVNTPEGKQKMQNAIGCSSSSSSCESPYKSCLDTAEANVKWREANGETITEGLTRASASAASLATGLVLLCAAVLRYFR